MVKGLDKFREYFKEYSYSYVIIGGTACDIVIDAAGLTPRATKDIDIILVVEALDREFVKQFWRFIVDGKYGDQQISETSRKYYRFLNPGASDFPQQIELFSRKPDIIESDNSARLTPIPVDDDLSSLSAILMDDPYYAFTIIHSTEEAGLKRAQTEALICLKAKAFLDMQNRKEKGENLDDKKIKKHKLDVFRLALLLTAETVIELPDSIKADMQTFVDTVKDELPEKAIFKEMGAANTDVERLFSQLLKSFSLVNK